MKLYKTYTLTTIILILGCFRCISQELPPIQNFTPATYNSGKQNWSISQSDDELIYVANNEGLLEFNGARWKVYPSPNETLMRSVKSIGDKIYTGCYMEFGYWEKNELGELLYTSLSESLQIDLIEDEEFWSILEIDGWVVFQSLNRIYIYNPKNNTLNKIDSDAVIVKMFEVNDRIYFQRKDSGIFQIVNGKDGVLSSSEIFKTDEVVNIFPFGKALLILTRNNGFYTLEDGRLKERSSWIDNQKAVSIYNAIQLKNGNMALGTISHGVIILDNALDLKIRIDQSNGLLNNTALYLFEDSGNNLWIGLDNGISYLNPNSEIGVYVDQKGDLGSVYASAIHKGYLYLGTNQGLFFRPLEDKSEFKFIEGTQGQVWCLSKIEDQLFCGHHFGTYLINQNKAERISPIQGAWNIRKYEDFIIQGNYDGLYVLEKKEAKWQLRNKIEGFDNSSRYFEATGNTILVDHEYKGIFNLTVDRTFTRVLDTEVDVSLKGSNSSIAKYQNNIYYSYKKGVFKYDPRKGKFVKDSVLSSAYTEDEYVSGRFVIEDDADKFWLFAKNNIVRVSAGNLADVPTIEQIPLTFATRRNVVEYENIIPVNEQDHYLLGTSFGYITFDLDQLKVADFSVYINNVTIGINEDHSATNKLVNPNVDGDFGSSENNLRMSFHTPVYLKYFSPAYQFQLEGIYDVWSEWTHESTVFYENLPPGKYTFNVRSKIGDDLSDNVATYSFRIAKPWYRTNFMIAIYFLGVIAFSIFMHNVYRRYYRKQEEKLIEENRKELELTRLQNEKEIIKLQNEQLEKDFKNKSNELAASTMSIIKKNELLTQIKDQLSVIHDKASIKPVIKIIDKSLNHNENWEMFKEAFDNADAEFFKNLKSRHPNLSPNDLKLCAYLRLNLSSKEVSQLINISPRSVEVKRYRLRKKLNLDSNENLTDYILSI